MGLLIAGAVFPAALAIDWKGQPKAGDSGALARLAAGLIASSSRLRCSTEIFLSASPAQVESESYPGSQSRWFDDWADCDGRGVPQQGRQLRLVHHARHLLAVVPVRRRGTVTPAVHHGEKGASKA
ncbi:hypothetical protein GE09DRAFT_222847 [Coniochaeta sp. 2T2.1]|nr:hypothetical protein GE09DRAFT_222847 [Coniochaeta sp. 2T2.1]